MPSRNSTCVTLRGKMARRGSGVSGWRNLLFGAGCSWDDQRCYFLETQGGEDGGRSPVPESHGETSWAVATIQNGEWGRSGSGAALQSSDPSPGFPMDPKTHLVYRWTGWVSNLGGPQVSDEREWKQFCTMSRLGADGWPQPTPL